MQIIIDMPDSLYENILICWENIHPKVWEILKNGTPLPKGHWIDINGDKSLWRCSHCGQHSCCYGNFCTDCGADMRES